MTTPLLSEASALQLLSPVLEHFVAGPQHAWSQLERLRKLCADQDALDLIIPLNETTLAGILNNHCVTRVIQLLGPSIATEPDRFDAVSASNGLTGIRVVGDGQAAFVRFKLLDGDLRSSNVSTGQQLSLDRQEWEPDLLTELGYSPVIAPTLLTCGYQIEADQTGLNAIVLMCRQNGILVWCKCLWGAAVAEVEPVTLDHMPARRARIVSRTAKPAPSRRGAVNQ